MKSDELYYVCDEVKSVRDMYHDIITNLTEFRTTFEYINALAISHYRQYAQGYPPSITELKSWHPKCVAQSYDYIMSLGLSQTDIQLCQARQYGYVDWNDVILRDQPLNHIYEKAIDTMLEGDLSSLQGMLAEHKGLINMCSPFAHGANLIYYIAANGVETHRQITPYNAIEIAQKLLSDGIDMSITQHIYGGGCTVINLIKTSAHTKDAGVMKGLISLIARHRS